MVAALCGALASLTFATAAGAKTIDVYRYAKSFNASDAIGAGAFTDVRRVDVDQQTGTVYVAGTYAGGAGVFKFNENGESQTFSALGTSIIPASGVQFATVKVDNSTTASQGRIYAFPADGPYRAFESSGAEVHGFWPLTFSGETCGAAVDPRDGSIWFDRGREIGALEKYTPAGLSTGEQLKLGETESCDEAVDSQGNVYQAGHTGGGKLNKFGPLGESLGVISPGPGAAVNVDLANDDVYWATDVVPANENNTQDREVFRFDKEGHLIETFGRPEGSYVGIRNSSGAGGVAINDTSKSVYVTNERPGHVGIDVFKKSGPIVVPNVSTSKATPVSTSSATLRGVVNADGVETTGCYFEYAKEREGFDGVGFGPLSEPPDVETFIKKPCLEGNAFGGSEDHAVSAQLTGLENGKMYFFRLTAENANQYPSHTELSSFITGGAPKLSGESVSDVNTDGVAYNATINPESGGARYWVEYGTEAGVLSARTPATFLKLPKRSGAQAAQVRQTGLTPNTEYFWRFVAENDVGTAVSAEHHFRTFPAPPTSDTCENALVRKQTGASRLLDCRAYELVSAADQGGYDVDSDLIPGDTALIAAPDAQNRFLYSIRYGALPGVAGSPTTFGHDPYVAVRDEAAKEWKTSYVGLPADSMPSNSSYGSPLAGYDGGLSTFAFGGENICNPCFGDGSINEPVRLPNGTLIKGMEGSVPAVANPAGEVRQPLSEDGSHFIFGTEAQLDPQAPSGSVSIYSRDLNGGGTQLVSTSDTGPISGSRTAELDVSADGSRVLIGKYVREDGAGNEYFDLYMHVGSEPNSVKVVEAPGGVLYDGMDSSGTQVYFSTDEALAEDSDTSVDLYRAEVGPSSSVVSRVSTGKEGNEGNEDACAPSGSPSWNAVEGEGKCGTVAFAGGAGVAAASGAIYFISPEQLDGSSNGTPNEANVYVAAPGQPPHFVATINSSNVAIEHAIDQPAVHSYEDFQVTPDGQVAAFTSSLPLAGAETHGHTAIYRYSKSGDEVICVSCGPATNPDAGLSPFGLNVTDSGNVFFTSAERLALEDTNKGDDAYEWENGALRLISSGTNAQGSRLASVSADGKDAFFFTRDTLVPQDKNGSPVKVYDARANGGFLYIAPPFACKASDECHGPGTEAPPPAAINTRDGSGRVPNPEGTAKKKGCKKGFVRRKGKCVKKHRHHRKHQSSSRKHG